MTEAHEKLEGLATVDRRRIELYLRRLVSDLESVNARYVALCNEVPEADGDDPPLPLIAAVIASMVGQEEMGSTIPLTPAAVVAAMSLTPADDASSPSRSSNLAPPVIVELPHVRAVHVRRLVEQRLPVGNDLSLATETYFVPVPDAYTRMLVVQFSTPNLADASAFSEVFAAIAETIRFYREGEETTL